MGGSEKVYFETVELLREKGHEVIFFSTLEKETIPNEQIEYFVDSTDYKTNSFIKKVKNISRFIYSKESKLKIEKLIESEKPDIAHLHIFYGNLTSSILPVLKKNNIPVVMSVHEYRMMCPTYLMLDQSNESCELCANGNYINCIRKQCNKGSLSNSIVSALECYIRDIFFSYEKYVNRFIMVSKFIMSKHAQYRPNIEKKAVHIYNFLDVHQYNTYKEKGDYFLYVGRLSKEKGIDTLIKAFQKLPMLKLKIAGDGILKDSLEAYVQQNNIKNIDFLGFLNTNEIQKVQANATFLVIPSEWYENNPMVGIEALSMGKPIIGANIGGIPELINHEKNGFLFEPKNIDDLVKTINKANSLNDKSYERLSMNARLFAEKYFDRHEHYIALMNTYKQVIKELK